MDNHEIDGVDKQRADLINAEIKRIWQQDNLTPLTFEEVLVRCAWYTSLFTKYWPDQVEALSILSKLLYDRLITDENQSQTFTGKGSKYVH